MRALPTHQVLLAWLPAREEVWWNGGETVWLGERKQEASTWASTALTQGRERITDCCQNKCMFPWIMVHLGLQVFSVVWSADPPFPVKQEEPNEWRWKFKVTHSWQLLRWVNAGGIQVQQCVCRVRRAQSKQMTWGCIWIRAHRHTAAVCAYSAKVQNDLNFHKWLNGGFNFKIVTEVGLKHSFVSVWIYCSQPKSILSVTHLSKSFNESHILPLAVHSSSRVPEASVKFRWKWDHELNELRFYEERREVKGGDSLANSHNRVLVWLEDKHQDEVLPSIKST